MSRTGVTLTLTALVGGLVAALHGCSHQDCCGACPADDPAVFRLTCSAADLTSVVASGPCATPDASLSSYVGNGAVFVRSPSPGTCHVELTFATGFTYSTDVTFASQPGGVCGGPQCKCGDYLAPGSGPFMVNNPRNTCVAEPDAGADVGAPDGPPAPSSCGRGGDCGPNYECAYLVDASCPAAGVCVAVMSCGGSGKQPTYCGCDGGSFVRHCDLPGGYSQEPVSSNAYPPCILGDVSDAADAGAE